MKVEVAPQKKEFTKMGLLFYLYNIPICYMKEKFGNNTRKYSAIVDNDYKSIDRDILNNFCEFLNVTPSLVLDNPSTKDTGRIKILTDNNGNHIWLDFDTYIYLRTKGIICDRLSEDGRSVIHEISFFRVKEENFKKVGISYLLKRSYELPLINPIRLRINNTEIKKQVKVNYEFYIHNYLLKFMSEKEIQKNAKGVKYKEIVSLINDYMEYFNKQSDDKQN